MTPTPGTLVFAHTTGILGRAIRFGQRMRYRGTASFYNHVAIVDRVDGEQVFVIQAEARGVTNDKTLDSVAPGGAFTLITPPPHVNVDRLLEFARGEVGSGYGWLSILSASFDIATPDWLPSIRRDGSWICSAISAEALRAGGWIRRWPDVYCVTPAQLWNALVFDNAVISSK